MERKQFVRKNKCGLCGDSIEPGEEVWGSSARDGVPFCIGCHDNFGRRGPDVNITWRGKKWPMGNIDRSLTRSAIKSIEAKKKKRAAA